MFDDPKKDLRRMEQQLLQVEEEDDWLEEELADVRHLLGEEDLDATRVFRQEEMPVRNFANGYGRNIYYEEPQYEEPEMDFDEYRDEAYDYEEPPRKDNTPLVILALLETLAIVGVVMYWLVKLL